MRRFNQKFDDRVHTALTELGFNILKIKFNAGKKKFELFANESFISCDNNKTKLMEYAKDNFKC